MMEQQPASQQPASPQRQSASQQSDEQRKKTAEGGGGNSLSSISYKECLSRVDATISQLGCCDDVDEYVRLVKEGEACLTEAKRRISEAEGVIRRILPGEDPTNDSHRVEDTGAADAPSHRVEDGVPF